MHAVMIPAAWKLLSPNGLMIAVLLAPQAPSLRVTSPLKGKKSMVLTTTSQATFFALLTMNGKILSKFSFFDRDCSNVLFSVRAKLWNVEPGYDFTSSFFLRCLYEDESGDPEHPAIGFLKGSLLLRVSTFHSVVLFQNWNWVRRIVTFLQPPPQCLGRKRPKQHLGVVMSQQVLG